MCGEEREEVAAVEAWHRQAFAPAEHAGPCGHGLAHDGLVLVQLGLARDGPHLGGLRQRVAERLVGAGG